MMKANPHTAEQQRERSDSPVNTHKQNHRSPEAAVND